MADLGVTASVPPANGAEACPAALLSLFERDYRQLCRLAYLLLGDAGRAEEVVMEAFARSFVGWRRIRQPDQAGAYVRRAVVNLARTRLRRGRVEGRANAAAASRTLDATRAGGDPVDHVWTAVRALPHRQRAAVVLRYWEDRPEAEIADTLGCSVGTVKSQLAKARATLARVLGEGQP